MAVAVGQRCVVRIQITDINLRNARDIVATVESPQYVAHCQEVSFDEVSGLVYVAVDVNSAGSYSMWLEVRFAKEVVYTPAFVFAEVEGDAKPCDAPYIVDVEVAGESVSVTPPKVNVDAVTREEFEQLSKDVAGKVDKVEGKGLSTNDYTDEDKAKVEDLGDNTIIVDYDRIAELKASEENDDVRHPEIAELVEKIYNEQEKLILVRTMKDKYEGLNPTYYVPDTNYSRGEFAEIIELYASYTDISDGNGRQRHDSILISLESDGKIWAVKHEVSYILSEKSVIDKLTSNSSTLPLSARQGKELDRKKQDKLTLSTKDNGNIEISGLSSEPVMFMPATPSGDPMHYMYEAVGAVYNDIGTDTTFIGAYGDTLVHKANHWRLNDLGDLTKKEMADIYREAHLSLNPQDLSWWWAECKQRTNICRSSRATATATVEYAIYFSNTMLTATLGDARPNKVSNVTRGCSSLKSIIGVLDWSLVTTCTTPFSQSSSLRNVRIKGMKVDISFADSPLLSKESLLYMIDNCASGVSFTITLHPNVYAKCQEGGEWFDDVDYRLARANDLSNTIITLASV